MAESPHSKTRIYSFAQLQVAINNMKSAYNNLVNNPIANVSTFVGSYNNWYSTVFQTASGMTDIALGLVDLYYVSLRNGIYTHWSVLEDAEDLLQGTKSAIAIKVRYDYFPTGIMMPDGAAILAVQLSNGSWITQS